MPYEYENEHGEKLIVTRLDDKSGHLLLVTPQAAGSSSSVCIAPQDVREVTSQMHEWAGLPDRWAELRAWLSDAQREAVNDHRQWDGCQPGTPRAARAGALGQVLARMDEIGAGQ